MCLSAVGGIFMRSFDQGFFLNRSWFVSHFVFQGLQFVSIDFGRWLSRSGMISQQCWFIQVDEES